MPIYHILYSTIIFVNEDMQPRTTTLSIIKNINYHHMDIIYIHKNIINTNTITNTNDT